MSDPDEKDNAGCDGNQEFPSTSPYQANSERSEKSKASPKKRTVGKTIGPYRLKRLLGEGGMGSVWLAEQTEPIKRQVAIKTIHRNRSHHKQIIARFEAERQALAMMDHRNIAKVLDAGISEEFGPYFVMEYCKGLHITKFCAKHKLNLDQRLKLFVQVCNAVQHAHQKGIIHRDLKPGNIIVVRQGNKVIPKVIDFGLVKAMEADLRLTDKTLFSQAGIGTYAYMSPEQVGANPQDVDTRADVYALGIILYELLTGSAPITAKELRKHALDEVYRIIREQDPPRPSIRLSNAGLSNDLDQSSIPGTWKSSLESELDWVVMKALQKDRESRYRTVETLSQDVNNYLSGNPVSARPPSSWYQFKKYISKHKSVAASIATISTILITSLIVISWLAWNWKVQESKATTQEQIARKQEQKAKDAFEKEAVARKKVEDALGERNKALGDLAREAEKASEVNQILVVTNEELKSKRDALAMVTQKAIEAANLADDEKQKATKLAADKTELVRDLEASNNRKGELLEQACNLAIARGKEAWNRDLVQDSIAHFCSALRLNPYSGAAKRWLYHSLESHRNKGWHPPINVFGGSDDVLSAVLSQDGQHVALMDNTNQVTIWNVVESKRVEGPFVVNQGKLTKAFVTRDKNTLLLSGDINRWYLWRVNANETKLVTSFFRPDNFSRGAEFSQTGDYVICRSWGSLATSEIIDTNTGKELENVKGLYVDPLAKLAVRFRWPGKKENVRPSEGALPQGEQVEKVHVEILKFPSLEEYEYSTLPTPEYSTPPLPDGIALKEDVPDGYLGDLADSIGLELEVIGEPRFIRSTKRDVFDRLIIPVATGKLNIDLRNRGQCVLEKNGRPQGKVKACFVSPRGDIFYQTDDTVLYRELKFPWKGNWVEEVYFNEDGSVAIVRSFSNVGEIYVLDLKVVGRATWSKLDSLQSKNIVSYGQQYISSNADRAVASISSNAIGVWDLRKVLIQRKPYSEVTVTDVKHAKVLQIDSRRYNGGIALVGVSDIAQSPSTSQSESSKKTSVYVHSLDRLRFKPLGPKITVDDVDISNSSEQPFFFFSKNLDYLVVRRTSSCSIFETKTGTLIFDTKTYARFLGFGNDNNRLLFSMGTDGQELKVLSLDSKVLQRNGFRAQGTITSGAFSPTNKSIAVIYGDGWDETKIQILDSIDFKPVQDIKNIEGPYSCYFDSSGKYLVVESFGDTVTGKYGSTLNSYFSMYHADNFELAFPVQPTMNHDSGTARRFIAAGHSYSDECRVFDLSNTMPTGLDLITPWIGDDDLFLSEDENFLLASSRVEVRRDGGSTTSLGTKSTIYQLRDESPAGPLFWPNSTPQAIFLTNKVRFLFRDGVVEVPLRTNIITSNNAISEDVIRWAEAIAGKRVAANGSVEDIILSERQDYLDSVNLEEGVWQRLHDWLNSPVDGRAIWPE